MNILFDVSALGMAQYGSNLRTGIFRVVENLALGLHAAENCHATFCASHCNYKDCSNVLDLYPELSGHILSQPQDLLASFYNYVEPLRIRISKLRPRRWKVPLRKAYHFGKQIAVPIAHQDLKSADVFHSPFLAIPQQINQEKKIAKFITIHDLTPFLFPEYCSPPTVELMKIIFGSINPDTFVSCISEATRQDFLSHMPMVDPAMVSVVPLAAGEHFHRCTDSNYIHQTRVTYGIPAECSYFLALSTLQPHKNFERIINSFIRIVREERIRDVYLVIAGADGLSCKSIYKEIESSGDIAGRIIMTGYIPDEDLAPLYSGAMAFLFPSLYEGFGLPALEAMQCGTPVITSNISSLPEVVGEAAIKIDPRDDDALSQAMLDVYLNEDLRKQLSRLSLERAKKFSWKKTTGKYIDEYRKALKK